MKYTFSKPLHVMNPHAWNAWWLGLIIVFIVCCIAIPIILVRNSKSKPKSKPTLTIKQKYDEWFANDKTLFEGSIYKNAHGAEIDLGKSHKENCRHNANHTPKATNRCYCTVDKVDQYCPGCLEFANNACGKDVSENLPCGDPVMNGTTCFTKNSK